LSSSKAPVDADHPAGATAEGFDRREPPIAVSDGGLYDFVVSEYQQPSTPSSSDWEELGRRLDQLEREQERQREHDQLAVETLRAATSHAMAIRESARREAELTLRKARAEAEKQKTAVERERNDARNELFRLRRVTEEMRRGLTAFLTERVEELRLESEEAVPAPEEQELDQVLGSLVEAGGTSPGPTPWDQTEVRDPEGHGSSSRSPDDSP
jgi:uncharacterized membrane protein YqiK